MKKIIISTILLTSFSFCGEYDPFDYTFKREIKQTSVLNNINQINNLEIIKNKNNSLQNQNLELTVTKFKKDEKKDSLNNIDLSKSSTFKDTLTSKKDIKVESIDSLLDQIKFTQEEKKQILDKEVVKELSPIQNKPSEKNDISNEIKDIKPILSENESYILLYENKTYKGIKNKLLINDIKNAYILKNKKNNNYGIFVNSKEYNINKIALLYKEQKEYKYQEINSTYDLFKNYLNN